MNKKKLTFVMIFLIGFSSLYFSILPLGHDLWFHMYRIGAMAVELKQNPFQVPIRILTDTYNGYGYGAPLFYGDFFLYIPAILVNLGVKITIVYRMLIVFIWLATFWISYLSSKRIVGENFAFYLAFFYTFSSTCVTNLCIRSAIGESSAFIFIIPVFAGFYGILYQEKDYRNWLTLCLGMTGIIQSHVLTLILSSVILLVWCIVDVKIVFRNKRYLEILKAAVVTVLLNASFVFPMLEQMVYQKFQTPSNSGYQKEAFMDYSLDFIDFLIPYEIKKIAVSTTGVSWNLEWWHPGAIALFSVFIMILYIIYYKNITSKRIKIIFAISGLSLFLLWFKPFLYLIRNYFSFIQFPWRVLVFSTVGISVVGAYFACRIYEKKVKILMLITSACIAFFAIGTRYAYQAYVVWTGYEYVKENNPDYAQKYIYAYNRNAADNMYLPVGTLGDLYSDRGNIAVWNHAEVKVKLRREKSTLHLNIMPNRYDDLLVELPLYMYKGYIAYNVDTGEKIPVWRSENKLVTVQIPVSDEAQNYAIRYEETIVQQVTDIVSALTLLVLILYTIVRPAIFRWHHKEEQVLNQ